MALPFPASNGLRSALRAAMFFLDSQVSFSYYSPQKRVLRRYKCKTAKFFGATSLWLPILRAATGGRPYKTCFGSGILVDLAEAR